MKIQHRFSIYMSSTVIFFLIVFSFLSYGYSRSTAINTAQDLMHLSAEEGARNLGNRLVEKSKIVISMASSDTLLRELTKSNMEYEKLNNTVRDKRINSLNSRWSNATDIEDTFVKSYMHNSVALLLKKQQQALPDEVGEIFITNRYGLAIGTTKKLSTLAHSQKYWWKAAYNNGQGKIFFDDRGYDKSVGDYVIGIVVPIKVNDQVVGILKCNFKLLASLSDSLRMVSEHDEHILHKVFLARTSGQVIIGGDAKPLSTMLPDSILDKLDLSLPSSIIASVNNTEQIVSYAPVGVTYSSDKYAFGGRYKLKNRIGAANKEGWILLFTNDIDSVLSSTINATSRFIYVGLILALLAGITALLMGRKIAQPIRILTERANRIGHGHIDEVIDIQSSDELGVLAQAFNQMSHDLQDSHSELQRKERLATLGQLTATVSHELRNPLGAMRPSLYVIERKSDKEDERIQSAIERIDRNIDRCDHIIDELLDFTRITELEREPTLIDEWLMSVILEQTIPEGILLEKDFGLNNIELAVDTARLRRVVINAIENACHSMMDDNQQSVNNNAHINIKTCVSNNRLEIIIKDTGSGIAKDVIDEIFEPLFSTKSFGVGLGMPTIKQIMQQHGGGVEVESKEGKGTAVTLWLPLNESEQSLYK